VAAKASNVDSNLCMSSSTIVHSTIGNNTMQSYITSLQSATVTDPNTCVSQKSYNDLILARTSRRKIEIGITFPSDTTFKQHNQFLKSFVVLGSTTFNGDNTASSFNGLFALRRIQTGMVLLYTGSCALYTSTTYTYIYIYTYIHFNSYYIYRKNSIHRFSL
jgi:hypothetical protein